MRVRVGIVAAALAGLVAPRAAAADDNAESIRAAAKEFDEGRRLFLEGRFEPAAAHFENAFIDAPRAEPLRNAIRARRSAHQYARAGTLAQLALAQYPSDAATAQLATEALAEAGAKAHAVVVQCEPPCAIAADGRAVSLVDARTQRIFLDPGPHDLAVSFGARTRQVRFDAKVGGKSELSVKPPDAPPVATGNAARPSAGLGEGRDERRPEKPLGPALFVVLAGLTAVGGGATVVSGLDAKANPGADAVRRDCAGRDESCPTYQRGLQAQLRTNVLLGATAGLALVTAVVGVFFTQWGPSPPASTSSAVGWIRLPGAGAAGDGRPKPEVFVSPLGVYGMF